MTDVTATNYIKYLNKSSSHKTYKMCKNGTAVLIEIYNRQPDVFFSCAFFAGVIHICLSGAYPRSPRLGEVAELSPLNSAWEIMGCKCNRQSDLLPD